MIIKDPKFVVIVKSSATGAVLRIVGPYDYWIDANRMAQKYPPQITAEVEPLHDPEAECF